MKIEKKDIWLFLIQAVVWGFIVLALPMATLLSTQDIRATATSLLLVWNILWAPLTIYFVNFYLFGPYLFFRQRFGLFALCNLVLILCVNYGFFLLWLFRNDYPETAQMTADMWIGFFSSFFMFLLLDCFVAAIAIGIRHMIRTRQIRQQLNEEKPRTLRRNSHG